MNLNSLKEIEKLDAGRVAESIRQLPAQIEDAYKQAAKIKLPAAYKKINKIVVNGMGGSNLGARIISSVFKEDGKLPILIEPGYIVPGYVDKNTLFIISSYSGSTEEPIGTYAEAKKRGAKIAVVVSDEPGNKLAGIMKKENLPGLIFSPKENPSNQPRLGLGYTLFSVLGILIKAGALDFKGETVAKISAFLKKSNSNLDLAAEKNKNQAKQIAAEMYGREAVLVGGEFLEGSLHTLRNQICENSKNFSQYLVLPDLNHYSLESLSNPKGNPENIAFLFFSSRLYRPRLAKRLDLTMEVVKKNKIKALRYELSGATKLMQAFEVLQFGSYLTFYLAMLNEANPVLIPWVDWFKKELK